MQKCFSFALSRLVCEMWRGLVQEFSNWCLCPLKGDNPIGMIAPLMGRQAFLYLPLSQQSLGVTGVPQRLLQGSPHLQTLKNGDHDPLPVSQLQLGGTGSPAEASVGFLHPRWLRQKSKYKKKSLSPTGGTIISIVLSPFPPPPPIPILTALLQLPVS